MDHIAHYAALDNLASMFFDQAERLGDRPLFWAKRGGRFEPTSWTQAAEQVAKLAAALRALGVAPGDRVALASENRPEWGVADIAIMALGALAAPGYATFTVDDHAHLLADSGAKAAITSNRRITERVAAALRQAPDCKALICMEGEDVAVPEGVAVRPWAEVMAGAAEIAAIRAVAAERKRNDTCCLIYTSGTGGKPKGVMLSHGAILCNCMGAYDLLAEFGLDDEVFLSFLPLSHSYEHTAGLHFPISIGAQIYYAEGVDKLAGDMVEARPTIMTAVPRLYETLHARITRGVRQAGGLKARLFNMTLKLGLKKQRRPDRLNAFERFIDRKLDKAVRDKVRTRFGGRLKAFVSGGAPLNPEIGRFFVALGVLVLQGYGQTESAPVVSCNRPKTVKMHTVGPPFPKVEVRIADDGEILVRGELVMQGYWNLPQLTAETVVDGWLHTGDIGRLDEDGFIQITDRKKDIIVNSGGDNISPQRVEGALAMQPEIGQAMVHGDMRPYLVALIVPDAEWAHGWAGDNGKPNDLRALIADPAFAAAVDAAVKRAEAALSPIERVRRHALVAEPFSVDNGMMTPSMKIRRHVIRETYGDRLAAMY